MVASASEAALRGEGERVDADEIAVAAIRDHVLDRGDDRGIRRRPQNGKEQFHLPHGASLRQNSADRASAGVVVGPTTQRCDGITPGARHIVTGSWRTAALRRFQTLIPAISSRSAESAFSS